MSYDPVYIPADDFFSVFPTGFKDGDELPISPHLPEPMLRLLKGQIDDIPEKFYLICPCYYRRGVIADIQIGGTGKSCGDELPVDAIIRESFEEMSIVPRPTKVHEVSDRGNVWKMIHCVENFDFVESFPKKNVDSDKKKRRVGFFYWCDGEKALEGVEVFKKRTEFSDCIKNLFFIRKNDVMRIIDAFSP